MSEPERPRAGGGRGAGRYCVIGAGAAGLAALDALLDDGQEVDCFEATDRVGGHWHTDYQSLHLITSRDLSGFVGHPMPAEYPVYPSRDEMRAYLEGFAVERGLIEHIRFATAVESLTPVDVGDGNSEVEPPGSGGWRVRTSGGVERTYDAVVVANGHLWDARLPTFPGTFTGKVLHSVDYHDVSDIDGRRVLVVGSGNSGCDIAVDAAMARLDTTICVRRGHTFQPKAVFGRPRAELRWLAKLPLPIQERVSRLLVDVVIGRPSRYRGLPDPETRNLNDQPPVVNTLLPYWIQHGRIRVAPAIARFDGATVHFVDGTSGEFDTVLLATGFNATFPFLDHSLLQWRDGVPLRVAAMTVPVGLERLYFVGLAAPRGPQLPVYSHQARLVARFVRLVQDRSVGLAAHFADREPHDSRIDIVRKYWTAQLNRANREVDRLGRGRRATPADVVPADSIWQTPTGAAADDPTR